MSSENKRDDSYDDILKSTSMIGGSQAVNYLIGMVRTKLVAWLLGPAGIGAVGLFQSVTVVVGQITGLGIGHSGVRQIAEANGSGNTDEIAKTVKVLRRACWATGILGWAVTACFAQPLCVWAFKSPNNTWLVAILGITLFLGAIASGQRAILQGTRRVADLARMTILSGALSSIVAVLIYAVLRADGIVPVLIANGVINLAVCWWFARRVDVPPADNLTWSETCRVGAKLSRLGFAFMWAGLLLALTDLGIRGLIHREIDLEATGIYQAAWGLSGLFAGFILNAMATDFYPRLTAAAKDHQKVNAMINEQIEIGVLIALPGLLGMLAYGQFLLILFYTEQFASGVDLLPWFILGIFCKVIQWPVGFAILAKDSAKWYATTHTVFYGFYMLAAWALVGRFGLPGVGMAYSATFIPGILLNFYAANRLTKFTWSYSVIKLLFVGGWVVAAGFASALLLPKSWNLGCGTILTVGSSICAIRGITKRVGPEHRVIRILLQIPGMRFLLKDA